MDILLQLIMVHAVLGGFLFYSWGVIFSDFAERSYAARMNSMFKWFLMPGPLSNKETWIASQKAMAWFGAVFVPLVYGLIMWSIFGSGK